MRSRNSRAISAPESAHMAAVKESGCAVCGAGGYVEAHHIEQGLHFTTVGLCQSCHRGPLGIHGDRTLWRIHKMDEIKALNETLRRVYGGGR